jgi:hypothetical protein
MKELAAMAGMAPSMYHGTPTKPDMLQMAPAYILRIRDAGLKTQRYDKGLDRFVRKFDHVTVNRDGGGLQWQV